MGTAVPAAVWLHLVVGDLGWYPVTVSLEVVLHRGVLGEMAGICDEADVEGRGCQALLMSVVGHGVFVGVTGAVVCLCGVADDTGHGAEDDEEV